MPRRTFIELDMPGLGTIDRMLTFPLRQVGLAGDHATLKRYHAIKRREAHRQANRSADGISLLNEALELVERTDERWYEAELYRLMAGQTPHGARLSAAARSRQPVRAGPTLCSLARGSRQSACR